MNWRISLRTRRPTGKPREFSPRNQPLSEEGHSHRCMRAKSASSLALVSSTESLAQGEERHIAAWKSKKVTTKLTEEEEDGTTVIRERERFVQELSVVFARPGETGTLE